MEGKERIFRAVKVKRHGGFSGKRELCLSNSAMEYHCVREFAAAIIREWTHGNVKKEQQ